MRKEMVLLIAVFILILPIASAIPQPQNNVKDTTTILCTIDGVSVEKEMSLTTIQDLIDMGKSCKEDFLTIYDKTKSTEEVTTAFENIKPFFQALIENGLTDKTVEELNTLYYTIRAKIREPRHKIAWNPQGGPQPLGLWNGIPTPVWGNVVCGIFDAGMCAGFAAGTHTIIPTIGVDAFITYGFTGESITVGGFGMTLAVTAFQVIFGFAGVLLTTPLIMIGPYFMTGICGAMFGVGA